MAGSFISSRTGAPLKVPAKFALSSSSQESCGRLSTCASEATISLISRLFGADLDLVARAQDVAGDVDALAVHEEVAVADELPRLRAREREAEAVDDVVEARLEQAEHLLAGAALPARRVEVVLLELALEHAVDATHLLLLAQADRVLAELDARLAVLPRGVRPAGVRALLGVAALSLEEELHRPRGGRACRRDHDNEPFFFSLSSGAKTGLRARGASSRTGAPRRVTPGHW